MKAKVINSNGRDKKFIGAAVGLAANVVGGLIGRAKEKRAAKKQAQANAASGVMQNKANDAETAAAMSEQFQNQEYVDQMKDKLSFKNGGKTKVSIARKDACGGRKKALFGSKAKNNNTTTSGNNTTAGNNTTNGNNQAKQDNKAAVNNEVSPALSGIGGSLSSAFAPTKEATVPSFSKASSTFDKGGKTIKANSWEREPEPNIPNNNPIGNNDINNPQYKNRLQQARFGKRYRRK